MSLTPTIQSTLQRYQSEILASLQSTIKRALVSSDLQETSDLAPFYGQMQYHLGWVDTNFSPVSGNPGKLLRPTLLLLAYEATGEHNQDDVTDENASSHLSRALPAAAAIELTHNFTLIHDDIEDGDRERRHRSTLWNVWGIPQAINTGDGMFALARYALWDVVDAGVDPFVAVQLGAVLDKACLVLAEGQYLDISFENQADISVTMYVDMIGRKTAALMGCAAEMGAMLGTRDAETIFRFRSFGHAIGTAFQVRDDMLGVWASTEELGKTPAGDIYRRKKSLPILHALEFSKTADQRLLRQVYSQKTPVTSSQVEDVLAVFERTQTREYCSTYLIEQCRKADEALADIPRNSNAIAERAISDMEMLVRFVEATAKG
ncbi:MAG TPA: polyprenyl synthetase family protein [Ktedonobacteraceae bacterium]|nr:polyprenyl synthetase family protein [Ktedonobacteraceae bacterium]